MKKQFPFYQQHDAMDCGPACLRMITKHYGKSYSLQTLRERSSITREGVSLLGISDAAESIGMHTIGIKTGFEALKKEVTLPCIVHWNQEHFVVVYKIKGNKVYVADPAFKHMEYTQSEFLSGWTSTRQEDDAQGLCLQLEPTPDFYTRDDEASDKSRLSYLLNYFKPYKRFLIQLFFGMTAGSLLQLIFPFLTQSVIDYGVNSQNLNFIYLVLAAQLILFAGQTGVDFIRGWILLHVGTRINISLISDFLIKLMKLPIGFFDSKMIGDLMQRIEDHERIEDFLTSSTLNILFSFINLLVFSIVLCIYNGTIFAVFVGASAVYVLWIVFFMKRRRDLDYKQFALHANNQSNLIQMITSMQEIKLNNCERQKRWEWERIQARLFKVSIKGLSLDQYQQGGGAVINQIKNIVITFLAAKAVINGNMTLGMMLAVSYIIGQLNSPLEQFIYFMHALQDAKISFERLGEIHEMNDEEPPAAGKITILPGEKRITISNLDFCYTGAGDEPVLQDINLEIPAHKVTAIVGMSGSGKTTLLKLLLGFYPPTKGKIVVGETNLKNISNRLWRSRCGAVMQDGFIFSDTIAKNIALSDETVDSEKLLHAVKVANINDYIESLPLGFNTKIGSEGNGISQGQKQRLLIARAVYKNPEFIFFDEATNALDANNEKIIMGNLDYFFKGRTVIVAAHRLSTVKNADRIVVIDKGRIVEIGTHEELIVKNGFYYHLVKNQLELGG